MFRHPSSHATDRGTTLIEIMAAVMLLGVLVPSIYSLIVTIERNMQRSYQQEQVYQLVQRAVEATKSVGGPDIRRALGELPPNYSAAVHDLGPVAAVAELRHYRVTVYYREQNIFEYDFYWSERDDT